jgi:hypothetical protein
VRPSCSASSCSASFFIAIFAGFPIAFTLLFLSLGVGYLAFGEVVFYLSVLHTIGLMKEQVLVAVPLFIFMGYLLEEGGLMERLFHALRLLFGPLPGSLYVAVLVTATIFGIAAGTVGATVAVVGIMAAPTMMRAGIQPAPVGRSDHRRRQPRDPHPAQRDADRDGADDGRAGRRPLCGVVRPGLPARGDLRRVDACSLCDRSAPRATVCRARRRALPSARCWSS